MILPSSIQTSCLPTLISKRWSPPSNSLSDLPPPGPGKGSLALRGSPLVPQTRMRRSLSMPGTTLQCTLTLWIISFSELTLLVGYSGFHAVGTAAISRRGAPWGVLDPDLRVKGTKGLRVVDASAIPYVPTGHSKFILRCERPVPDCDEQHKDRCTSSRRLLLKKSRRDADTLFSEVPG